MHGARIENSLISATKRDDANAHAFVKKASFHVRCKTAGVLSRDSRRRNAETYAAANDTAPIGDSCQGTGLDVWAVSYRYAVAGVRCSPDLFVEASSLPEHTFL